MRHPEPPPSEKTPGRPTYRNLFLPFETAFPVYQYLQPDQTAPRFQGTISRSGLLLLPGPNTGHLPTEKSRKACKSVSKMPNHGCRFWIHRSRVALTCAECLAFSSSKGDTIEAIRSARENICTGLAPDFLLLTIFVLVGPPGSSPTAGRKWCDTVADKVRVATSASTLLSTLVVGTSTLRVVENSKGD